MHAKPVTASVVAKANKVRFMLRHCEMNPDCWRKPGNKKPPSLWDGGFGIKPLAMTYSCMA